MMQEKKKLDDMAEKYKEEMMRIYNKKKAEQSVQEKEAEPKPDSVSETVTDKKEPDRKHKKKPSGGESCESESSSCGDEQVQRNKRDNERLMHPPMPKIPYENSKENSEKPEKTLKPEKSKFPTAKELMEMECADGSEESCGEETVPAAAMQKNGGSRIPDPRFESEGNVPDDMESNDGHMQGNYNFCTVPDGEDDDQENCESGRNSNSGMFRQSGGQGYLQAEVTEQGSGSPISGAAVVVLRKLGDNDSLEAVLTTDSHGMTEAIALDVSCEPAGQNGDPDSCGEYMVTVYKEGFYSVNMLPVPIFDTIKSIQPVEMTKAQG